MLSFSYVFMHQSDHIRCLIVKNGQITYFEAKPSILPNLVSTITPLQFAAKHQKTTAEKYNFIFISFSNKQLHDSSNVLQTNSYFT